MTCACSLKCSQLTSHQALTKPQLIHNLLLPLSGTWVHSFQPWMTHPCLKSALRSVLRTRSNFWNAWTDVEASTQNSTSQFRSTEVRPGEAVKESLNKDRTVSAPDRLHKLHRKHTQECNSTQQTALRLGFNDNRTHLICAITHVSCNHNSHAVWTQMLCPVLCVVQVGCHYEK